MGSQKVRLEENEMAEGNKEEDGQGAVQKKGGLIVTDTKNECNRGIQRR